MMYNACFFFIHFRDNKEIKQSTNTKITEDGKVCTLKITNFTKTTAGLYKCIATNTVGSAECEATANLYGKLISQFLFFIKCHLIKFYFQYCSQIK